MGGHCLPVDPFYLSWRAREFDMSIEFIELTVLQSLATRMVAPVVTARHRGTVSANVK
jgi:UDP-N-acetyl-D-mannosaminuronate dehydrogenase